jgi:hypothetical protein
MNDFLGRDLGIEIECLGCASTYYNLEKSPSENKMQIIKDFGFVEFDNENIWAGKDSFAEQNIRIQGYKGAANFKKWLLWNIENLVVNRQGGVHIHVDFRKEFLQYGNNLASLAEHLEVFKRKKELLFLINTVYEYKGNYNAHVINTEKRGCICFRGDGQHEHRTLEPALYTIEFRMGICTFDYKRIMKWAICSTLWAESVSNKLPLSKKLCEEIMLL